MRERLYPDNGVSRQAYETGTVPIACSGWRLHRPAAPFAPLQGDLQCDVAVVGAGLAGSSLALHLQEAGVQVALIEARQPADGASGRNAGHVQPFLDKLNVLQAWPQQGQPFLDYFVAQRRIVFELGQRHGFDSDAHPGGMLELSHKPSAALEKRAQQWRQRGYHVEAVQGEQLAQLLGSSHYAHGMYWQEGGSVNPYLLTNNMARAAQQLGGHVHGDSPVQDCVRQGSGWQLVTPQGRVQAQHVVVCTNGHADNVFFPELARTQYPLVACAFATQPLSPRLRAAINPQRLALTQVPTGLFPTVVDGMGRLVSATLPSVGGASQAQTYFHYFAQYMRKVFPITCEEPLQLESYWTGYTSSASQVYHEDYAKVYRVADGVTALMNLGTWGNVMGPLLGQHLAQVIAQDRWQDLMLPLEQPQSVAYPQWYSFKMRRILVPLARCLDRMGVG